MGFFLRFSTSSAWGCQSSSLCCWQQLVVGLLPTDFSLVCPQCGADLCRTALLWPCSPAQSCSLGINPTAVIPRDPAGCCRGFCAAWVAGLSVPCSLAKELCCVLGAWNCTLVHSCVVSLTFQRQTRSCPSLHICSLPSRKRLLLAALFIKLRKKNNSPKLKHYHLLAAWQ